MNARRIHNAQRGMALIAALFLIVVLAGVGIFAMRINASQQESINLTLLGNRALAAANSGIEFGANQALTVSNCPASFPLLNLTQAALNGFSVQVKCTSSSHINALTGVPTAVYELDALAQRGTYGKPGYVSRHITRTVSGP